MKRTESEYVTAKPARRPLKIFATDPMLGRTAGKRITIDVTNESLQPGPQGDRVEVIDYDGGHNRFYPPVNLDVPAILMQGGLDPTESDPRFHQQMVYAVAKRTLENFDRALGRGVEIGRGATNGSGCCRMHSMVRMPFTIAICMRSCSAISAQTEAIPVQTFPVKTSLLVCRTTSSPTR